MSRDDDNEGPELLLAAAEKALGLLTPSESAAFEDGARILPDWAEEERRWEEIFAGLARDLEPVPVPEGLQAAVMEQLFPAERAPARRRSRLLPVLAALGLAGPLALALFVVFAPPVAEELALTARLADGLVEAGLASGGVPEGQELHLWLVAADGSRQSLGVMPHEGALSLLLPGDGIWPEGAVLGLSLAPAGERPDAAAPLVARAVPAFQ